jgi:hypothetical protein
MELVDESDQYFQPSQWYAIVLSPLSIGDVDIQSIKHSCMPTHELSPDDNRLVHLTISLILPLRGDDLTHPHHVPLTTTRTMSRIDSTQDYEDRTELLQEIGIAHCDCRRCAFEQAPLEDSYTRQELDELLSLAKPQDRFDDAMHLVEAILRLEPKDANAQWERTLIAGWQGHFTRRERLLEQVPMDILTSCPSIGMALMEAKAYYRDDGSSCDNTTPL